MQEKAYQQAAYDFVLEAESLPETKADIALGTEEEILMLRNKLLYNIMGKLIKFSTGQIIDSYVGIDHLGLINIVEWR